MTQPAVVNIQVLNKSIKVPTGLFINNEFVPSSDSKEVI
jgi:aldehyde dehydrogenase (NAD+)